ncbi:MAG: NAD(P)H-dependent oxidoreductase subunit E [Abditibacteriota bacterium]|nr:NAD(P)H-dependent oxidoreductase subunit E [Abditibacteriota bacterium]
MAELTSTAQNYEKVCAILDKYGCDSNKLIPILQKIQEEYNYLPEDVMTFVATKLCIPPSKVFGVATFFAHFALEAKGKHIIKICNGTACHVKKSIPIREAVRKKLNLAEDKNTTDDMLFTIETVFCVGACGLAPVMIIDDEVHGKMTPEKAIEIIDKIIEEEKK